MSGELARKLADWIALGRRLLAASPAKWEEIMRHVGGIVEGQEVLGPHVAGVQLP